VKTGGQFYRVLLEMSGVEGIGKGKDPQRESQDGKWTWEG